MWYCSSSSSEYSITLACVFVTVIAALEFICRHCVSFGILHVAIMVIVATALALAQNLVPVLTNALVLVIPRPAAG